MKISLTVNGAKEDVEVDGRLLLAEVLRDRLGLKGTRIGCLTGDCGACTVEFNGELRKSCLMLALGADGEDIRTVEAAGEPLDTLRSAFVACHGFQCGYCTSGMMMVAADLLTRNPHPTAEDIRVAISGNLCRCTGYDTIVAAILKASTSSGDENGCDCRT